MIDESIIWNTGTNDGRKYQYNNTPVKPYYMSERSNNTGKLYSGIPFFDDTVNRTTEWSKTNNKDENGDPAPELFHSIGLMYPSDYGYATSGGGTTTRESCLGTALYSWNQSPWQTDCANNDWLKPNSVAWTLTADASTLGASGVFQVDGSGFVASSAVGLNFGVIPVVYLSSSVFISDGDGSMDKPYTLEL